MPTWSSISRVRNQQKWYEKTQAPARAILLGRANVGPQVYERGIANITHSVDLWTEYCSFKMETTHDPHLVRE